MDKSSVKQESGIKGANQQFADLMQRSLLLIEVLQKEMPNSDKLTQLCSRLRNLLLYDTISTEMKEILIKFLLSSSEEDKSFSGINQIKTLLAKYYTKQEYMYEYRSIHVDSCLSSIYILVGILVTIMALSTSKPILLTCAIAGLGIAIFDVTVKIPLEMYSFLDINNSQAEEYRQKTNRQKLLFFIKRVLEDPQKILLSLVTLFGAIILLLSITSPAIVSLAPILVPVTVTTMSLIGIFLVYKELNKCKSLLNDLNEKTKDTHIYAEKIILEADRFHNIIYNFQLIPTKKLKEIYSIINKPDTNSVIEKNKINEEDKEVLKSEQADPFLQKHADELANVEQKKNDKSNDAQAGNNEELKNNEENYTKEDSSIDITTRGTDLEITTETKTSTRSSEFLSKSSENKQQADNIATDNEQDASETDGESEGEREGSSNKKKN
ncbi:MAG: hypothetical protein VX335_02575 [Pseudomonadota bacterium]|nr:hypothetical protein [Pseudomonadota bacterium]